MLDENVKHLYRTSILGNLLDFCKQDKPLVDMLYLSKCSEGAVLKQDSFSCSKGLNYIYCMLALYTFTIMEKGSRKNKVNHISDWIAIKFYF